MRIRRLTSLGLGLIVCTSGVVAGLASPSRGGVNLPTVTVTTPVATVSVPTVAVPTVPVVSPTPPAVPPAPVTLPPVPPAVTTPVLPPVTVQPVPAPPVPVPPVLVPSVAAPPVAVPAEPAPASVPLRPAPAKQAGAPAPAPEAAAPSATSGASAVGTAPASSDQAGALAASSAARPRVAAKPLVHAHTARASSLRITKDARHRARSRSVLLLLRLPHGGRLHIALIGPSPSCLTARTLTRRVRQGINRLQVGPVQVHGLKSGRYLVRIPVSDRPTPLLTAVRIVAGRRVVPGRRPTAFAHACIPAPPVGASSSSSARTGAGGRTVTPPAHHDHHGLSPSAATKAIAGVTRGAGHVAATAAKSTGQAALRHLLLLLFISLLLTGGWAILIPIARFIHPPKHS